MTLNLNNQISYAIDFGTSNSLLVATDGERCSSPLALDPFAADPTMFRTLLFFPHAKKCFFGTEAKMEYAENDFEGRFIRSIKKFLPNESYRGTWIEDRVVKLEDLVSLFLAEMKKRADKQIGKQVESVVLGRPVQFSKNADDDRLAQFRLEKAAKMAGFKNVSFFPEPLAAAYSLKNQLENEKLILVVDLGGGTSDFTVFKLNSFSHENYEVLALDGVPIAGDAIDGHFMQHKLSPFFGLNLEYRAPLGNNIMKMPGTLLRYLYSPADLAQIRQQDVMHFFTEIQKWAIKSEDKDKVKSLICLVEDNLGFQIFEEVEKVKIGLSKNKIQEFVFKYPDIDIQTEIEIGEFNNYISDSVGKIMQTLENTLSAAQVQPENIDHVYCTGGTSKLLLIKRLLEEKFGQDKIVTNQDFHSVIEGLGHRALELQ